MGRKKSIMTMIKENYVISKGKGLLNIDDTSLFLFSKDIQSKTLNGTIFLCHIIKKGNSYYIQPHKLIGNKLILIDEFSVIEDYIKKLPYESEYLHPLFRSGVAEEYIIRDKMEGLGFKLNMESFHSEYDSYIYKTYIVTVPKFKMYGSRNKKPITEITLTESTNKFVWYEVKTDGTLNDTLIKIDDLLYPTIIQSAISTSSMIDNLSYNGSDCNKKGLSGFTILSEDSIDENIEKLEEALSILKKKKEDYTR